MSIQSLSSNNASIAAMRAGMGNTQSLQGGGALPVANILQSVGQLLTALTPMLLQAVQQAPLSPNAAASGLGGGLQSMAAVMGSINQLLTQVLQQAARHAMGPQGPSAAGPMNPSRVVGVLDRHFDNIKGPDGNVGRRELAKAADNPSSPPELKAAANYMLSNPKALASLDRADATVRQKSGEQADGRFSKGDLTATLQKTSIMPADKKAIETLVSNKSSLLSGDKLLSRAELSQVATTGQLPNGKAAPAELRVAAQHILSKPELFDRLDDANLVKNNNGQGPRGDGKISLTDMQTTLQAARPAIRG